MKNKKKKYLVIDHMEGIIQVKHLKIIMVHQEILVREKEERIDFLLKLLVVLV